MKKELDKELYPDYVYPEFTPDPNETDSGSRSRNWAKRSQTGFRRNWD